MNSFNHAFLHFMSLHFITLIHSIIFNHSFCHFSSIQSFNNSFICSFVPSLVRSFFRLFAHSIILGPSTHPVSHASIHSVIHSFSHSFIQPINQSIIHSIYSGFRAFIRCLDGNNDDLEGFGWYDLNHFFVWHLGKTYYIDIANVSQFMGSEVKLPWLPPWTTPRATPVCGTNMSPTCNT